MKNFIVCIGVLIISIQVPHAQEQLRFRNFELGSSLTAVSGLTGTAPTQVTMLHERPAVIQELEWRPRYFASSGEPANDAVAVMTFNFYNDQLFRIVVDYDRYRTAGMTEGDLIDAMTIMYGPASKPAAGINATVPSRYGIPDTAVATWGSSDHAVTLLRVSYPETFRLVLTHTRLEQLARTAAGDAVRLDAEEAPQRDLARRKKEAAEAAAVREKLRIENKAVFNP